MRKALPGQKDAIHTARRIEGGTYRAFVQTHNLGYDHSDLLRRRHREWVNIHFTTLDILTSEVRPRVRRGDQQHSEKEREKPSADICRRRRQSRGIPGRIHFVPSRNRTESNFLSTANFTRITVSLLSTTAFELKEVENACYTLICDIRA